MSTSPNASMPSSQGPADREEDLTLTYIKIVILEVVIILLLWLFGRAFS